MNLLLTGLVTESHFQVQPETPGAVAAWRNITRGRLEFPTADGALSQYLTPVAGITYTFDNFPAVELNGDAITNDIGVAAAFTSLFLLHLRVAAYRPDLAASGNVAVTITDLFGTGAHNCGVLQPGDEIVRTKKAGFTLLSTSALTLVVTSPVNLAIELLAIGIEAPGGVTS
jgi:hypothetical protein